MLRRTLIVVLAALSGACGTNQWVKQGASAEQSDEDTIDCQRQAMREANLRAGGFYGPSYTPLYGPLGRRSLRPNAPFDFGSYRMLDEAQLTSLCMRAKGYRLDATQ